MCLCLRVCAGSIKPWWSRNAPLGACSHRTGGHTMCLSASPTCGALPWYIFLITHPASFPPSPCFLVSLALTHSTQNPCAAATWCRSLTGRRGGGLPWRMWVSHTHRTRPPVSSFCVCASTLAKVAKEFHWAEFFGSAAGAVLSFGWVSIGGQWTHSVALGPGGFSGRSSMLYLALSMPPEVRCSAHHRGEQ